MYKLKIIEFRFFKKCTKGEKCTKVLNKPHGHLNTYFAQRINMIFRQNLFSGAANDLPFYSLN